MRYWDEKNKCWYWNYDEVLKEIDRQPKCRKNLQERYLNVTRDVPKSSTPRLTLLRNPDMKRTKKD